MKTLITLAATSLMLFSNFLLANTEQGGQFKNLGSWQVHYIAFPSTVLQPQIAKHYGIERSNYNAVINISVLDKQTKKAQKVAISGVAKNLVGQNNNLKFKEVIDGDAIYYIATLNYSNEETFRFVLDIRGDKRSEKLNFHQKLYVD